MKVEKKPATILYPVPAVMVTCQDEAGNFNIITIAWTGTVCSVPPMVSISVRPDRYSHKLISKSGHFVINIPTTDQVEAVDYCGMVSGREVDKFKKTGLTPIPASLVNAPLIKECPVNVECEVKQIIKLASHDLFLAEIVANHIDEEVLNDKGRLDMSRAKPLGYGTHKYWALAEELGVYGFSREKL
ncbi:MAG: flavin reductase family protein [Syntrophomonadaceae bacterium]|nr:flavin reductase family protein [Syntrophomonadaceae bacterium]